MKLLGAVLHYRWLILLLVTLSVLTLNSTAQNGGGKPEPAVIAVPEVESLRWQNLRLRIRLLEQEADAIVEKLNANAPAGYQVTLNQGTGSLQYSKKPEPPKPVEKKP